MKKKVLVGMSGGVDSAVSAHLLLEQGYDVIAGFMKNYADESNPDCHTREDRNMALKVSQYLGIKTFIIFDFREEYEKTIIEYIYNGYKQGLTPNPDVLCNSEVKFKLFLDKALELGCDHVATGHYARVTKDSVGYHLLKGVDESKDQSYFLAGLDQEQLSKSLFPLGSLKKTQVRKIAQEIGLPNADKKDSQGLCFIGKVPMKEFLKQALPEKTGDIIDTDGKVLGTHQGAWFYTIGQRQGLGLSGGPRYVIQKNVETNTIIVGVENEQQLFKKELTARLWHWISEKKALPYTCNAKIRYRQSDQHATLNKLDESTMHIVFKEPQRAISPGQTVALYDGDELIGSGIIS